MRQITDYGLEEVSPAMLNSSDLWREVGEMEKRGERFDAYKIISNDVAERGEMVYAPDAGRAGIAWGADAQWTDCDSPEDAVERFLGLNGKEMVN